MFKLETITQRKADGTSRKVLCKIIEKHIDDKNTKRYAVPVTEQELLELDAQLDSKYQQDKEAIKSAKGSLRRHTKGEFDEPPAIPEDVQEEARTSKLASRVRKEAPDKPRKRFGIAGKMS